MRHEVFFSRGKFLLSGEYVVLHGAKALCVPLKPGQTMTIHEQPDPGQIVWETYVELKPWFHAAYQGEDLEIISASDSRRALFVRDMLKAGLGMQSGISLKNKGFMVKNLIDFNIDWGLGSSSSLMSNLAAWLQVDLYSYYRKVFQGSGFDVFTSRAEIPITYQLIGGRPVISGTSLSPKITEHLYFVYLGNKQDSQESVRNFRQSSFDDNSVIEKISDITDAMANSNDINEFGELMDEHEITIAKILGISPVKELLFNDFQGKIKSLGAWGGDFVMVATDAGHENVKKYFEGKKLDIVFKWDEIVN